MVLMCAFIDSFAMRPSLDSMIIFWWSTALPSRGSRGSTVYPLPVDTVPLQELSENLSPLQAILQRFSAISRVG